jgi:hypothetical protein
MHEMNREGGAYFSVSTHCLSTSTSKHRRSKMKSAMTVVMCVATTVVLSSAAFSAELGMRHHYTAPHERDKIYDTYGRPLGNVLEPGQKYWQNGIEKHCVGDWLCDGGGGG